MYFICALWLLFIVFWFFFFFFYFCFFFFTFFFFFFIFFFFFFYFFLFFFLILFFFFFNFLFFFYAVLYFFILNFFLFFFGFIFFFLWAELRWPLSFHSEFSCNYEDKKTSSIYEPVSRLSSFLLIMRRRPRLTLFPYCTLFLSTGNHLGLLWYFVGRRLLAASRKSPL